MNEILKSKLYLDVNWRYDFPVEILYNNRVYVVFDDSFYGDIISFGDLGVINDGLTFTQIEELKERFFQTQSINSSGFVDLGYRIFFETKEEMVAWKLKMD